MNLEAEIERMKLNEPSDCHHLSAAMGWLELGNHLEANEELEHISPVNRAHPDVLELRWMIYREAKRWDVCHQLAEAIMVRAPDCHKGWFYAAQSHYGENNIAKAYDTLAPAAKRFPNVWTVFYDLACYSTLLGRYDEAKQHLERAFELDDSKHAKLRSLDDPDLKGLWSVIGSLPVNEAGRADGN